MRDSANINTFRTIPTFRTDNDKNNMILEGAIKEIESRKSVTGGQRGRGRGHSNNGRNLEPQSAARLR